MYSQLVRSARVFLAIGVLVIGCAPSPTTAPVAAPPPSATIGSASSAPSPSPTLASTSASASDVIRLVAVTGKSEARYRVREQLVGVSLPSDAIGRTSEISGTIVGKTDGTIVSADSKFVVDLRRLQSDESRRDNFLRTNVLQTNQYPNAVFVPTKTEGLPLAIPPAPNVSFKLTGDLTIRNITKSVTWDVTCETKSSEGTCHAKTSFPFEYVGLTPPRVPVVLSVENNITLEVDVYLQRATN